LKLSNCISNFSINQGSKTHQSVRESYAEAYSAGDVIGCFIRLDLANSDANEIRFFKNGRDLGAAYAGSVVTSGLYFPAVSIFNQVCMLTL